MERSVMNFQALQNPLACFVLRFLTICLASSSAACGQESVREQTHEMASKAVTVRFEEAPPGSFQRLKTAIGTWVPEVGRTIIDHRHAKTGQHCLQLTGGKRTSVIVTIADDIGTPGMLSFWAERWTTRNPFSFRIEKETSDGWQELYRGDATVRVGRAFLNHVQVPLKGRIQRLRFTCSSPPNTGILIDDVRIGPESSISANESRIRQSLQLPRVFGSRMVLQADVRIPVWGQASPGASVAVTLDGETQTTTADTSGKWQVRLRQRAASDQPASMRIRSGDEQVEFNDVLFGEVWVCAGQSNMEWTLRQSTFGEQELANANHPNLRLLNLRGGARGSSGSYQAEQLARLSPERFCEGSWRVATVDSAQDFSGVAWYFGRHLQRQLDVPIGLICPALGGTPTEAWVPREALEAAPDLKKLVAGNWLDNPRLGDFCRTRGRQNLSAAIQSGELIPGDALGPNHSFKPGFMWEAGIEPLIPYAIRGAIWYQGESNAETSTRVREHGRLFPLLIQQWRERWGQGAFPFLFVQLPALDRSEWPWFRDGQRRILDRMENVGMAITIDTGLVNNVHPPLKKPVGERLAKWALGTTYESSPVMASSGPLFVAAERSGDVMILSFKHVGDGLKSSDNAPLRHFEVAGMDGVFYSATAKIVSKNTVAVSTSAVKLPVDARYAWRPYPDPSVNLFNDADLPASPFTTESTEVVFSRRAAATRADKGADP